MSYKEYRRAGATEKAARALAMREDGVIFRKIGEALGVSSCRAQELVRSAKRSVERSKTEQAGLSSRAINCLARAGYITKQDAARGIERGDIHPGFVRNYGAGAHTEVLCWVGDTRASDALKPAIDAVATMMLHAVNLNYSFSRDEAKREARAFVEAAMDRAQLIKAELEAGK